MRHQRSGKKLGRDSAHRKALYANLTGALIEHGRIKTTVTKAKAVKPIAEQMITLGRRGDLHARRQATAFLRSKDVVHKLFAEVAPRFAERPGGYTRIVKIGPRHGDAADMVYLELVDSPLVFKTRIPRETADAIAAAGAPAVDEADDEAEPTRPRPSAEAEAEARGRGRGRRPRPRPRRPRPRRPDAEADEAEAADDEPTRRRPEPRSSAASGGGAERGAERHDHRGREADPAERGEVVGAEEAPADPREPEQLERRRRRAPRRSPCS